MGACTRCAGALSTKGFSQRPLDGYWFPRQVEPAPRPWVVRYLHALTHTRGLGTCSLPTTSPTMVLGLGEFRSGLEWADVGLGTAVRWAAEFPELSPNSLASELQGTRSTAQLAVSTGLPRWASAGAGEGAPHSMAWRDGCGCARLPGVRGAPRRRHRHKGPPPSQARARTCTHANLHPPPQGHSDLSACMSPKEQQRKHRHEEGE